MLNAPCADMRVCMGFLEGPILQKNGPKNNKKKSKKDPPKNGFKWDVEI